MNIFLFAAAVTFAVSLGVTLWVLSRPQPKPVTSILTTQRSSNFRLMVLFVDADGLYQEHWYVSYQNLWDTLPKDVEVLWTDYVDIELMDYSAEFDRIEEKRR